MATSSLTALLIEDEPLIAFDLELALGLNGFEVTCVMSCAHAMYCLNKGMPDIAVVDIFLRDGTSSAVVELLRERDVPYVIYTGGLQSLFVGTPFAHGHWISKPAAPSAIVNAARALLSR